MKQCRWIWAKMHGMRLSLIVTCLLGILRTCASLAFVLVSKSLIDKATMTPHAPASTLWGLAALLAALMLTELAFSTLSSYLSNRNEIRLKNKMRVYVYRHVLGMRFDNIRRRHSGDVISRLIEDTRVVADAVCQNLPVVFDMLALLVGAFCLLFFMTPTLAVCILCIMPICILLSKLYVKRMRRITAGIRDIDGDVQSNIQEGIQHIVLVKVMGCVDFMCRSLDRLQATLYVATMERTRFSMFSRTMMRLGFITGYLTAFIWSVWHLYYGAITFGTMTAFLQLVARIQNPMANLARYIPSMVQATTSVDRLDALESEPSEHAVTPKYLKSPLGVRISDIDFRYDDSSAYIFKDFSHDFKPGSVTAIVGVTGIGKTTLIRLILALLNPQNGKIEMYGDGMTVEASADTRCNIAYVPQGNSLICDTIRNNLLVADSEASDAQIAQALHVAEADFVFDLPDGLDTVCGERAARLSEGQAQRIAIARALLQKGGLLILDEFNSSLDAKTAITIMERIRLTYPGRTIIMITHRTDILDFCSDTVKL